MRVDGATNPELIHQYVQGLTLPRMPFGALEAGRHHQPHGCSNAQVGPDQPVSFLRPTELASADALADEPPG